MSDSTLRITEIFYSLQGEADTVGWPTVFVRLTGCPLRCGYCDTEYAFQGGSTMALNDIANQVKEYPVKHVCVTGGEPLAQKFCLKLLENLCDLHYQVSLETSGAMDIAAVDQRVKIVMDIKTPASGESDKNLISNLDFLKASDIIKFVISDRNDYNWCRTMVEKNKLADRFQVFFSSVFNTLSPGSLADWILKDRLPVRFQLQLHKILWGNQKGR